MRLGAILKCWHCYRRIQDKESYWGYHYLGGAASSVVCLDCLFYLDGPEIQGLLEYAQRYGLAAAKRRIDIHRGGPSQTERSEPSGKS